MKEAPSLKLLSLVVKLETVALVALLGVAVPLKHFFGIGSLTTIIGPIHGFLFLCYAWMVSTLAYGHGARDFSRLHLIAIGLLPLGGFYTLRVLRKTPMEF